MASGHILDVQLPQVQPTGAPGGGFQHIATSPDTFGGLVARARGQAGAAVEKAGQTAFNIIENEQERQNDLHNVEVKSWFADQVSDLHSKYMNLEGRAALDGLPDYKKQVTDLRQQALNKVTAPAAQAKLASSLTSLQDQYGRYWSGHAGAQMNAYDKAVTGNAIATNAALAVNAFNAGDELGFKRAMIAQDNEVRNFYSGQHYADDVIEQEVAKRRGQTLAAVIDTAADSGNARRANELFEQYRDRMDAVSIAKVTAKLKVVNNQTRAINIVDEVAGGPRAPIEIAAKMTGVDEVADRDRLASYIHGWFGEKIDPAVTPWCAAFVNAVLRQAGYSGTGSALARSFLNYGTPVDKPQPGDLVIFSRGLDPNKGHVGFYVGPGKDPGTIMVLGGNQNNAVSTQQHGTANLLGYRHVEKQDIAGRLPPGGPGPALFADANKTQVMQTILDRPDLRDNPVLRNAAVAEVNRRFTARQAQFADQERLWRIDEHNKKEQYKIAEDELLTGIASNDLNWTSARVLSDPRFAWNREHALALLQRPALGEPDARHSALVRRELEEQIGLPPGNPNKVQTEEQVYSHFKDLTTKDYEAVIKQVRDLRSAGGQRLAERKKEFLAAIKARFRSIDDLSGQLYGESGQQFDLYRADLERKIDEFRAAKKDPFDLMDPAKPDYFGGFDNVDSYKRSLQEQLAERARGKAPPAPSAAPAAAGAPPTPAAPIAPATPRRLPNETIDAYLQRTGLVLPAQAAPQRTQPQPQVPMSR